MDLDVWLDDQLVARVTERRGKLSLVYCDDVFDRYAPETPLLSCSLATPGPGAPGRTQAFLEGLLPEGAALAAMAARVRGVQLTPGGSLVAPPDAALLLAEYGRECAGAVALAPVDSGWAPFAGRYEPLDPDDLRRLLADLPARPLGTDPQRERRMSLAGVQPKLVLGHFADRWHEPVDGASSTHILKPAQAWPLSADNEAAVMWLARAVGLTPAESWVEQIGSDRVFVTERYDRVVAGDYSVVRLHQEDVCQALGVRPIDKYALGRPSVSIARVLRAHAADPASALLDLLRQLTFRVIVGDEDGHGKNVSLLLDDGQVSLAPLYDSLSTIAYGSLDGKLGAPVGRQVSLFTVDRQALLEEGQALGIVLADREAALDGLAEHVRNQLDGLSTLELHPQAVESVIAIVTERVERLLTGAPLGETSDGNLLEPRNLGSRRRWR